MKLTKEEIRKWEARLAQEGMPRVLPPIGDAPLKDIRYDLVVVETEDEERGSIQQIMTEPVLSRHRQQPLYIL